MATSSSYVISTWLKLVLLLPMVSSWTHTFTCLCARAGGASRGWGVVSVCAVCLSVSLSLISELIQMRRWNLLKSNARGACSLASTTLTHIFLEGSSWSSETGRASAPLGASQDTKLQNMHPDFSNIMPFSCGEIIAQKPTSSNSSFILWSM